MVSVHNGPGSPVYVLIGLPPAETVRFLVLNHTMTELEVIAC